MRLSVHHETRYRFSEPQARIVQLLRLFPGDTTHQTVIHWRIDVDCDARLREGVDGYGNHTRMLYAEGPVDGLLLTITGEVLLSEDDGPIEGASEPFPQALFRRVTPLTRADETIAGLADGDDLAAMTALAGTIHARWPLDRRPTPAIRSAIDAAADDRLSPRDMAQIFVAAARARGLPARYVSGYSLSGDDERRTAAPHAWAEAYVAGGWYAFDPAVGGRSGLDHVRVAVALDAAGAAPIAGVRMGAGDEALDVDVRMEGSGEA
ncbi:transglutaminase family protein [Sphingomonas sp. VNH70]|uniref:transglutaminase family protein n=1 Tax=Sphingomonas silueang TaxID=3156617 RepID=UPI0032B3D1A9